MPVRCPKCGTEMVLLGSGENYGCPSCGNMIPAKGTGTMTDIVDSMKTMLGDLYN